jgi:hypothetical protein
MFTAIRACIVWCSGGAVEWEQVSENRCLIRQLCLITVPIQPLKKRIVTCAAIALGYKSKNELILGHKGVERFGQALFFDAEFGSISGGCNPESCTGQSVAQHTKDKSPRVTACDIIYVSTQPGADRTT